MDFIIEQVTLDDLSLSIIVDLLRKTFPKSNKFSFDYIKWQYKMNPNGSIIGFNAFDKDILAAHYVAMPVLMNIDGNIIKGLLSLNTATHPNYRGKGLFSILALKTYNYAAENGYDFIIGVANDNSTPGFMKNLGFSFIAPLNFKFGMGKITIRNNYKFARYWDVDTLKWRLMNPSSEYLKCNNLIYRNRFLGIKDVIGFFPNNLSSQVELSSSVNNTLNLYVGLGADLSQGYYYDIPNIIKRPPFNLIFKDLKGNLPEVLNNNILFQLLDFDVV